MRQLSGEVEQFRGFTRFSDFDGVLGAEIEPKNRVLPVLRRHFCERYHNETFFLYDRTHREALLYSGGVSRIVPLNHFEMAQRTKSRRAIAASGAAFTTPSPSRRAKMKSFA